MAAAQQREVKFEGRPFVKGGYAVYHGDELVTRIASEQAAREYVARLNNPITKEA